MTKSKTLTARTSEINYNKMWEFLELYNKKTGEDLTMSQLIWKAIKQFVSSMLKSWK